MSTMEAPDMAVRPRPGFAHARGTVVDRAGVPVDCSGRSRILNDPGKKDLAIEWDGLAPMRDDLKTATADYLRDLIRPHSPSNVAMASGTLVRLLAVPTFRRQATTPGATLGFDVFEEIRNNREWGTTYSPLPCLVAHSSASAVCRRMPSPRICSGRDMRK